jgi:hypothetical protein
LRLRSWLSRTRTGDDRQHVVPDARPHAGVGHGGHHPADADADNSSAVIQSAGVSVRKTPVHKPRVFTAEQGPVSGAAKLVTASAGHRSSYEWQYSIDGGKTWVAAPATLQAKTSVAGLTPGSTVQFRYLAVTKTGQGDWSQPVSLLVK